MEPNITNNKLFGFLTVDMIVSLIIGITAGTYAWAEINKDVESNQKTIEVIQARQEAVMANIGEVKINQTKIAADQNAMADDIGDVKDDIKIIRRSLEELIKRPSR